MVQINFAQKQVNAKIVYYGPGMSGKTTNLEVVHQRAPTANRGDLTSISTDGDRTLFFDFMPLDLGTVAGMRTCFQIYTVPGQVYYNSTRKLVLQGVDGVVFVADSSAAMVQENLESLKNLEQNLNEYGKSLASLPHVVQFNKRDLPDAMSVEELNRLLNSHNAPSFEAIANTGQGVFPTLKALAARVLETIHTGARPGGPAQSAAPTPAPFAAAPASPAAAGTGFNARPLQQTGYSSLVPGAMAPAAAGRAGGAFGSAPAPSMPRAPAFPGPDPNARAGQPSIPMTGGHAGHLAANAAPVAPPAFRPPQASAAVPMQIPSAPGGGPGGLQMVRGQPPAPPAPAARPFPPAAARPAARPQPARPAPTRPAATKPVATKPAKKSFTTMILVVAALVAGAVMAVVVFAS